MSYRVTLSIWQVLMRVPSHPCTCRPAYLLPSPLLLLALCAASLLPTDLRAQDGKGGVPLDGVIAPTGVPSPEDGRPRGGLEVGIPSPGEVLGHAIGERFTDHAGIVRYMEALDAASPRVSMHQYGTTMEGRPLIRVVFAREDRMSDLDRILDRNRELADPETPEGRAREIAAENPVVVYLSYGIHGRESSSSEAALWTAWNLARGAPEVEGVLDSAVVVMDPVLNPDGRDRYVNWYRQARARLPNPNRASWEHVEPWPGGRFNHYLFDMNRDWAWLTQPESRARREEWSRWTPQVHVDFHEMGWTENYLFFPANDPINPLFPESTLRWHEYFGAANSAAFDDRGWPYYTGEWFDFWYPGYGDTWASFHGAIGMTYEQGGSGEAGLAVERPDGLTLTLRDRADGHRTAGESTLRAAAGARSELLLDFATFHRTTGEGLPDVLLVPGADPGAVESLVGMLRSQEIRVLRAERAFRAPATPHPGFDARDEFPEGTFHVPARQPWGRLALAILLPEIELDATYTYDASAWALPYGYGVETHTTQGVPDAAWSEVTDIHPLPVSTEPLRARVDAGLQWSDWDEDARLATRVPASPGSPSEGRASGTAAGGEPYGYLVPPGFRSWPGLVRFLEAGGRAMVMVEQLVVEGREWPAGSILLPRHAVDRLGDRVRAAGLGDRAVPVRTGRSEDGLDLGSGTATPLRLPRVGVLMGDGISPTSFGAHWFFLEQTLDLPFDALPLSNLGEVSLGDYDVMVVPELVREGAPYLSAERLSELKAWIEGGGTLVAVGGGARALADTLAGIQVRRRAEPEDDERRAEALKGREERDLARWERNIPGTILPLTLDTAHPLAFGAGVDGRPNRLYTFHRGPSAFEPDTSFETVAHFPADLREVSGVMSAENREFLSEGSWLVHRSSGNGRLILFADDPLYRHFWYAGFQPYVNALLLGPRL
jgi:hypothetical protein